jgi:hypothetical protein
VFFYLSIVPLISELYSPVLASTLLGTVGPYGAALFNLIFISAAILTLPFLPETLKKPKSSGITTPAVEEDHDLTSKPFIHSIRSRYAAFRNHIVKGVLPLVSQRLIIFTLIATIINTLIRTLVIFLNQYMVARFHWRVKDVSSN